jgi:hypothetical protein
MDQVLSESAGDATARLVERMSFQATACERLGSPLYAHLLRCVATDLEEGGPSREILGGHESDPGGSALALRLMGAVNRLVLTGEELALDRIYRDAERDEEAATAPRRMRSHPSTGWASISASRKNSSMLRNHLQDRDVSPDLCSFRLVAHGPILPEAEDWKSHVIRRDLAAAVEKQLAEDCAAAGYDVLNSVASGKELDDELYAPVRAAFTEHFDLI